MSCEMYKDSGVIKTSQRKHGGIKLTHSGLSAPNFYQEVYVYHRQDDTDIMPYQTVIGCFLDEWNFQDGSRSNEHW